MSLTRLALALVLTPLALPTTAAEPTFAGTWDTTYGTMTLVQTGDEVRGTYVMNGLACQIEGHVQGRKLTFRYKEPDARGEGTFEIAGDGRSFAGRWREADATVWAEWTGELVQAAADPFDGVWDTPFGKMRLVQNGNKVAGCYGFDAGEIEGTVAGNRLTFHYTERTEQGAGRFDLSPDGKALAGQWRRQGETEWRDWPATRVEPEPGVTWLVVVETQWEEGDLARSEYAFGDMLRAFFAGSPQIRVRHRIFDEADDLAHWCRESAYLPEPVVLLIASHGSPTGVSAEGGTEIGPAAIAADLRHADNLRLLHFSSCLIMKGDIAEKIREQLAGEVSFPISGYTTAVDWAGSAVNEFMYLNLILVRNESPPDAIKELSRLLPFSGNEDVPGTSMKALGMRIVTE